MVNAVEVVDGIYNISTLGHSSNLWEEYIQRHLINLENILKHFSELNCAHVWGHGCTAPTFFIASKSSASR